MDDIPTLNLTHKRGDTFALPLEFTDDSGAMNITGWKVIFTAKKLKTDADPGVIQKKVTTHTNPTAGLTLVELSSSDTNITPGVYFYDVQITDSLGKVYTQFEGSFTIEQDISTATT